MMTDSVKEVKHQKTELVYQELCQTYHSIRGFRVKLLSFLPLASGGLIAFLGKFGANLPCHNLIGLGIFGILVTTGLGSYEGFNIKRCHKLVEQGAALEKVIGSGQFIAHPAYDDKQSKMRGIDLHLIAAVLIYGAVFLGWVYIFILGLKCALQ